MLKKLATTIFVTMVALNLTAAVPPVKESVPVSIETSSEKKAEAVTSYKELKEMAEEIKGEKLSFKEKLSLNIAAKAMKKAAKKSENAVNFSGDKSKTTALILCIFLGTLGVHRFYLGYTLIGIIQLLTLGGLGIWSLIDLIRIATGSLEPKDGSYYQ
jgi:TM2 domain-containing membrane protein YozV